MGALLSKKFNPETDIVDLKGKVVVVTGGNTGIGLSTVKFLARRGAKVYLGARNESKATGAIAALEHEGLNGGEVVWLKIDLIDPQSVKAATEEILAKEKRLDILVNNAAITMAPYEKTNHGIPDVVMVNVIGQAIFTQGLLPLLKSTANEPGADVRIVNLGSEAHNMISKASYGVQDFTNEYKSSWIPSMSRYGYSKVLFMYYSNELQARLTAAGVPILVLNPHPGMVNTPNGIPNYKQFKMVWFIKMFGASEDVGAHNSLFCAASPKVRAEADKYKGTYLLPVGKIKAPSKEASKPEAQKQVWESVQNIIKDVGIEVPEV